MGLLPAALLTELQKQTPVVQMWLDLGPLPDGTTWRISTHSEGTGAGGPGDPVVLKWGSTRKAVDLFTGELIPQEVSPEITDEGDPGGANRRKFARLAAKYPRSLRRTPAVLTWAGGGVTYTRFSGILKNYRQTGTHRWQLFCSTDDGPLNDSGGASVPKAPQTTYFPNTPDDLRQFFVSIVMGAHDSNGITNEGMIPCQQEDATRTKYLVGVGTLTVPAVYVNGIIRSTSTYTITSPTVSGLLCTRITFTSSIPAEGDVITADVDGLTTTVGGGGTLLKNGSQLLKWLVWFVYGDFRGGAYPLDSTAPVHVAAYTALDTFLARNGHESSIFSGGTAAGKAAELHRAWHESHETRPYWRHDGKLAAGVFDPIPPADIYALSYHFEANQDLLGDLGTPRDETSIARDVVVEYAPDASNGGLTQKHRLMDVTVPDKVTVSLQLANSGARVVA